MSVEEDQPQESDGEDFSPEEAQMVGYMHTQNVAGSQTNRSHHQYKHNSPLSIHQPCVHSSRVCTKVSLEMSISLHVSLTQIENVDAFRSVSNVSGLFQWFSSFVSIESIYLLWGYILTPLLYI